MIASGEGRKSDAKIDAKGLLSVEMMELNTSKIDPEEEDKVRGFSSRSGGGAEGIDDEYSIGIELLELDIVGVVVVVVVVVVNVAFSRRGGAEGKGKLLLLLLLLLLLALFSLFSFTLVFNTERMFSMLWFFFKAETPP